MKIALNHTYLRIEGGVERYVYNLANILLSKGHEVDFYGIRAETHINGLNFVRVPVVKAPQFLRILSFALFSKAILEKKRYDIIMGFSKTYYHNLYRDGSGCREDFLRALGRKRKLTCYELVVRYIEKKRYCDPKLKKIITVSNMVKQGIEREYPKTCGKIEVLYSGVHIDEFRRINKKRARRLILDELGVDGIGRILVFIGNDFYRKGLDIALSSIEDKNCLLVVLGKDKNMEKYKKIVKNKGLDSRVFFLGFRRDREVFLRGSDIMVLPARFDAIGNVIVEALASGTPVVTTRYAGGGELIKDGVNGFVCKTLEEFGEKLSYAIDKIGNFKEDDIIESVKDYSWENHYKKLMDIFDSI